MYIRIEKRTTRINKKQRCGTQVLVDAIYAYDISLLLLGYPMELEHLYCCTATTEVHQCIIFCSPYIYVPIQAFIYVPIQAFIYMPIQAFVIVMKLAHVMQMLLI